MSANVSRINVFIAVLLSAFGTLNFQIQPVLVGAFAVAFALTDRQAGLLAGSEAIGSFLVCLSGLLWLRRVNWRLVAAIALASMAAGSVLVGLCTNLGQLLAVRALASVGGGALYLVALTCLCDSPHADRAVGLSVVAQLMLGSAMFLVLPPVLAEHGLMVMMTVIAATLCAGFILLPWLAPGAPHQGVPLPSDVPRAAVAWLPLLVVACLLCFQMSLASIWAYIELMAADIDIPMVETGRILALALPLSACGSGLAAWLGTRYGRTVPLLVALVGMGMTLTWLAQVSDARGLFWAFLGQQVFWTFGVPYFFGLLGDLDDSGKLIALAPVAQTLGIILGPLIAAAFLTGAGYLPVIIVAATTGAVAVLGAVMIMHRVPAAEHVEPVAAMGCE